MLYGTLVLYGTLASYGTLACNVRCIGIRGMYHWHPWYGALASLKVHRCGMENRRYGELAQYGA